MSKKRTTIPKSTRFEDALAELETLVQTLEGSDQPLDKSLENFERGIALSRFCQQALSDAEQKIQVLLQEAGHTELSDFEAEED
ncbi:MAG TPA: exodeoxyribonuclease VII small subunit [Gammaproteobacteria bacterium]|jgi:exodeoxyribonuclease VII small subunit|nr:exodeoxyribonuclease VII small subunit [Gammaproteobacteria bacterium]